jgi:hypothetical protein
MNTEMNNSANNGKAVFSVFWFLPRRGRLVNGTVSRAAALLSAFLACGVIHAEDFNNRPTLAGLNQMAENAIESAYAVRERDTVVSRNAAFFPYCGHGQAYFASLQTELQAHLAVLYIDHVNGPLTTNQDTFCYFTVSTWRDAAGLNGGFRRVTAEGSNTYGYAQAGDEIGSWIFEDIQKGFSALKYTLNGATHSIEGCLERTAAGENHVMNCEAARVQNINNWNGASWAGVTPTAYYWVFGRCRLQYYDKYFWSGRWTEKIKIYVTDFILPFTADTYFLATAVDGAFMDIDGIGAEEGKYFKVDEVSNLAFDSEGDSYTSDYLFKNEGNPIELIPINCSSPWNTAYAIVLTSPAFLAKWVFTYN